MSTACTVARVPVLRRLSFLLTLGVCVALVFSATSCAQVLGINKDYKKGKVVAKGWYCEPAYYDEIGSGADADQAICDCACGAYDPDCDESTDTADHTADDTEPDGVLGSAQCRSCTEDAECSSASPLASASLE
jgi:hypothetical protein